MTKPPSTLSAWPVMPADSGSARNTAAWAICPGYVRAGMGIALQSTKSGPVSGTEIFERYYKRLVPQRRMIEAEEIAHAAVFLALPESAGVTGQALNVDGGFFMS